MLYVFGNEDGASVVCDSSSLTELDKVGAIVVDSLPQEELIEGKMAILKVNTTTKVLYYDYVDKPIVEPTDPIIPIPLPQPIPQPTNQEIDNKLNMVLNVLFDMTNV